MNNPCRFNGIVKQIVKQRSQNVPLDTYKRKSK